MSNILEEAVQELFIALTTRWRKENGILGIGITKAKLLKAGEVKPEVLDELLNKLRQKVSDLGLEVVEYLYEGEVWYAMRSTYVCPTELTGDEEAVLAVIISQLESGSSKSPKVLLDDIKKKLIGGKYFTETQLDRLLKSLEQLGYIEKRQKLVCYSPRTLLEFSEDSRKHIAEQSKRLIV